MKPPDPSKWHILLLLFTALVSAQNTTTTPLYDPLTSTIASTHALLYTHTLTCQEIISLHLSAISSLNPHINALTSLTPSSLAQAQHLDTRFSSPSFVPGPLHCIPLILKDNIAHFPHASPAGSLALANLHPTHSAPVVAALEAAGAIIIARANMHELALEGLTLSSYGGQTLNPYDVTRTPGGSSGGTAAAVAAGFAIAGLGTDTVNSLRSPVSATSGVSVRGTRGLVTRGGVVPVCETQDVVGPMGRGVRDVAVLLGVMAGAEGGWDDAIRERPQGLKGTNYVDGLEEGELRGLRVGVLDGFFDREGKRGESREVNAVMDSVLAVLRDQGVEIVAIADAVYDADAIIRRCDVQKYEFREEIERYLAGNDLDGEFPKTLQEIYDRDDFVVIPPQYEHIKMALRSSTMNATYATALQEIAELKATLHNTFTENRLDAIIYPQQKNLVVKLGSLSQSGRNGILAAVTGSPVVAMPAGLSPPTDDASIGVPVGMEILGQPWTEKKLLQIAYQVEQVMQVRQPPLLAEMVELDANLVEVLDLTPDRDNIPAAYPRGVLESQ